jgi:hypothetical protein
MTNGTVGSYAVYYPLLKVRARVSLIFFARRR